MCDCGVEVMEFMVCDSGVEVMEFLGCVCGVEVIYLFSVTFVCVYAPAWMNLYKEVVALISRFKPPSKENPETAPLSYYKCHI